jgi:hypothetical protein
VSSKPPAISPRALLEELRSAADDRDWEGVRRLCHPDALLVLRVSEGRPLPLDEALDVLRADADAGEHEPVHYYVDELDEHAAVALGSITREGTQKHLCWLVTFVDGLVYRQLLFESLGEAQAAYAELGHELGMAADARGAF